MCPIRWDMWRRKGNKLEGEGESAQEKDLLCNSLCGFSLQHIGKVQANTRQDQISGAGRTEKESAKISRTRQLQHCLLHTFFPPVTTSSTALGSSPALGWHGTWALIGMAGSYQISQSLSHQIGYQQAQKGESKWHSRFSACTSSLLQSPPHFQKSTHR